jgi:hypothetical protein
MEAMDFIKKKLFLILCIAVALLGIGIFISGMMVSADNQKEVEGISKKIQEVDGFGMKAVSGDEIDQAQATADDCQKNLEQMETWIQETTRRPVLFQAVFPKLSNEFDKDSRFEEFAKRYCSFVNSLLVRLRAGTCPSPQEEEQTINQFEEHLKGSSQTRIDEEEQMERICNELYQKRAQECVVYADSGVFCAYSHWQSLPRLATPMYKDAWYTQLAAWIQEDVVAAILELNGSSQSVLTSPVKRLLEITFMGEPPEGEPSAEEANVGAHSSYGGPTTGVGRSGLRYNRNRSVGVSRRFMDSVNLLPVYVIQAQQQRRGSFGMIGGGATRGGNSYQGHIAEPFTGHYSNDTIDVVQFEVGIIIDSTRIKDFIEVLESPKQSQVIRIKNLPKDKAEVLDLNQIQEILQAKQSSTGSTVSVQGLQIDKSNIEVKEISRNQITVLQMDVDPIDISVEQDSGYYYGSGSFKVLRLTCEYIFFKSGYQDLMPAPVKEILNPSVSQPATGLGLGGGGIMAPGGGGMITAPGDGRPPPR